ncbi:NAD(P)/FAD-dependent oxidoreductase [Actinomadura terrae]|uniref:NAD(P)/FAD-dependent oxidoreductase n=1 Tax=Actinomadura terrae TaxID=604353 RepID=UPI001FA7E682|nr:FAD-dependent monooxygenase [Actinomadura terrae]
MPRSGSASTETRQYEEPAVVLGAGIAGLAAAAVLADHFPAVLVVERDSLSDEPSVRRGVPQGAHLHGFTVGGRGALEEMLPGFGEELVRAGAQSFDFAVDLPIRSHLGWGIRFPSDLWFVCASRPLTEHVLRRRIAQHPRVTMLTGVQVTGLTREGPRVNGVTVRPAHGGRTSALPVGLVVDAMGRGSRCARWLEQAGFPSPTEEHIDPHTTYATRVYRRPDVPPYSWQGCYLQVGPGQPRGGMLLPIEGGRWMATLVGLGARSPSKEEADWLPFARSLASPVLAENLSHAEPLTPVAVSHSTTTWRRHLHALRGQPDNLVCVGDTSVCFNPIYGQGMSVAIFTARYLGECLDRTPLSTGFAHRFHRGVRSLTRDPWLIGSAADLRYESTTGPGRRLHHRAAMRYFDRVLEAGVRDPLVQLAFLRVFNMLAPVSSLLSPAVARRVLGGRAPGRRPADAPPPVTAR